MRRPELRSPLARAVVPVLAGAGVLAVMGLLLWAAAAYIAHHNNERSDRLVPTTFEVGRTKSIAATVAEDGPLIFPDLLRASGKRTIVLDHTSDNVNQGWRIYLAYPSDRDVECKVEQVRHTRTFTDCEGRTLQVEQLADPPNGVLPIVSADGVLTLDLLPDAADQVVDTSVGATS
jgi:hypothetical protein